MPLEQWDIMTVKSSLLVELSQGEGRDTIGDA